MAILQQGKLTTTARTLRNSPPRTSGSCSWRRLCKATTRGDDRVEEPARGEEASAQRREVVKEGKIIEDAKTMSATTGGTLRLCLFF